MAGFQGSCLLYLFKVQEKSQRSVHLFARVHVRGPEGPPLFTLDQDSRGAWAAHGGQLTHLQLHLPFICHCSFPVHLLTPFEALLFGIQRERSLSAADGKAGQALEKAT